MLRLRRMLAMASRADRPERTCTLLCWSKGRCSRIRRSSPIRGEPATTAPVSVLLPVEAAPGLSGDAQAEEEEQVEVSRKPESCRSCGAADSGVRARFSATTRVGC